jgi:mannose-1-phosphate guanylyltransferase
MHLASQKDVEGVLAKGENIKGNVLVDETASIDPTAIVGPNVVVGPRCKIGKGCKISNTTLLADSKVDSYTLIDGSIIGWKSTIGKWCRITNLAVIAEDVQVKDESYLNGTKVLPHKGVAGVYPNVDTILM